MAKPINDNRNLATRQAPKVKPAPTRKPQPKVKMTKSQRRIVTDDPYRNPSNKRFKWGRVTRGTLMPDNGYLEKETYTASTGRTIHAGTYDRRGRACA